MKMLLLGDVCPTDKNAALFKEKRIDMLFGRAVSAFENKDFVFVNLECMVIL